MSLSYDCLMNQIRSDAVICKKNSVIEVCIP
jgi:hypothetical protein